MKYELRLFVNYNTGIWHLVHWSEYGQHSVCGQNRHDFDGSDAPSIQISGDVLLQAASVKESKSDGYSYYLPIDHQFRRLCSHCAQIIRSTRLNPEYSGFAACTTRLRLWPLNPIKEETMIDCAKPIIVCSDGSVRQPDGKTLAEAKRIAKEILGTNNALTATIFVPHTKLERQLPPIKTIRIKCD